MFSIVRHRKIWFVLSAIMFVLSITAVATWGFKLGIDFTGGSLMEIAVTGTRPSVDTMVTTAAVHLKNEKAHVQPTGELGFIIRTPFIDEVKHQKILSDLKKLPAVGELTESRFETIGPTISGELKKKAVWSIFAVLGAIILYIAWAFRQVAHPLSSWNFGVVAIIALLHDVFIPAGIFALLGKTIGYEVDTLFVTAILTILGFSVHDTIVTFDRVREHLKRTPKMDFESLVDQSVSETFRRSINTSATVLLVLLPVFLVGGETIRPFTLTLILGVVFGTYSSIFIACPLLVVWNDLNKSKK